MNIYICNKNTMQLDITNLFTEDGDLSSPPASSTYCHLQQISLEKGSILHIL